MIFICPKFDNKIGASFEWIFNLTLRSTQNKFKSDRDTIHKRAWASDGDATHQWHRHELLPKLS